MGKISIRYMTPNDFAFAVRLTDTMNWDMTEEDFKFMINLEPEGCFVALDDTERVGIITTIHFDSLGWIGNLIVNHNYRLKGVGSLLMKHAVGYLMSRSVTTIGLHSYIDTLPFYERLGFRANSCFIRLVGQGIAGDSQVEAPQKMTENDLVDVIDLDKLCISGSRERLLRRIFADSGDLCYVARNSKQLVSFIMADWYRREIGPWVCRLGFNDKAMNLLKVVLNKLAGLEVRIGVPEKRWEILDALRDMNFRDEFKVMRMHYGGSLGDKSCLLAMESLERG